MTQKRLIKVLAFTVVLFAVALAFLAGSAFSQAHLRAEIIRLPDHTQITCVASDSGGVTCDWYNR